MGSDAVRQIERAIDKLSEQQLRELYSWLDQHHPQPIDARLETDLAAGHLDTAIDRAIDDESSGRAKPL
jgi:hypothetical protein